MTNGIAKMFLKIMGRKKNKRRKIAFLASSKLNTIEKTLSKGLIEFEVSHDEFTLAINEDQNYFRLKESIRPKEDCLGDIDRDRLTEHSKRIRINKILNENESLKLRTDM